MFDIDTITPKQIASCFPPQTPRQNIERYWPPLLQALKAYGMDDAPMVRMALATIRAESKGFEPISERRSLYNTALGGAPFGLYDDRRDLGNVYPGDGEKYRGRGFIQLTGRSNYLRIGQRIGIDLLQQPKLANDPDVAAAVLACFLADKAALIRSALRAGDLKHARKLVNGGSHGLDRFINTYTRALALWPGRG